MLRDRLHEPFGGHIRYGDFTHESWYTARKIALAAETGAPRGHIITQNPIFAARKAG